MNTGTSTAVSIDSDKLREYFIFHQERAISALFKSFLIILEDVRDKRYVIDENTYSSLRKKILDNGNYTLREVTEHINKFDLYLKHE